MRKSIRLCLSLFLTLTLLSCSAELTEYETPGDIVPPPANKDVSEESESAQDNTWLATYTSYIQDTMEKEHIPGLALAIVQGNETLLAQGFGLRDVESGDPVTPDTLFHIGSTHKSLTSMLIATLVDAGLFEWDTPVVEIYPDFALSNPQATQEVTLRHLLSMRSGIPDEAEDEIDPEYAAPEDIFIVAGETPLLGIPGEEFSYSNLSASLGGYIGVLAAGGSFDDLYEGYANLLEENVLDPIGMESATVYISEARRNPNYAKSYVLEGDSPVLSESYDFEGDALAPSGSLKANVREMALYISTQMNSGVAPNGTRVVSEEALSETWRPYLEEYAMGWEQTTYSGVDMIWHTGAYDDFASVLGFIPDLETGFVILLNCEEAGEALTEEAPYVLIDTLLER